MQLANDFTLSKSVIFGAIEFSKDKDVEKRNIQVVDSKLYNSNIQAGKILANILGNEIFINLDSSKNDKEYQLSLQEILKKIMLKTKPAYLYSIRHGREAFVNALTEDEYQCFNDAGLLNKANLNNVDLLNWWDEVEKFVRKEEENNLLKTGRIGEIKTLNYEVNRLKKENINKEPLWIARENNNLGYDIKSFDKKSDVIYEIFIESKCTKNIDGHFFLTLGEWRKALQKKDKYFVYHWHIDSTIPKIIKYEDLKKDIAINQGRGEWKNIEIKITPNKN